MDEVGNVEYIFLSNQTCNVTQDGTTGGAAGSSTFTWRLPYIKPQESPLMYIQACQVYFDDVTNTQNPGPPYTLRLTSAIADNYYANDSQFPVLTLLYYDGLAGHFANPNNNPLLEVTTRQTYISFQIYSNLGVQVTAPANASLNILLKVIRPKQLEMTKNNVATYARMLP